MSDRLKTNLIKYGLSIGIGGAITYYVLSGYELSTLAPVDLYRVLCDSFTVPGLLMVLIGLLITVSNSGGMDGLGYVLKGIKRLFLPTAYDGETYAEYLERVREKRVKGYGFLYVTGLCFLAVSLVFLLLYESVYTV